MAQAPCESESSCRLVIEGVAGGQDLDAVAQRLERLLRHDQATAGAIVDNLRQGRQVVVGPSMEPEAARRTKAGLEAAGLACAIEQPAGLRPAESAVRRFTCTACGHEQDLPVQGEVEACERCGVIPRGRAERLERQKVEARLRSQEGERRRREEPEGTRREDQKIHRQQQEAHGIGRVSRVKALAARHRWPIAGAAALAVLGTVALVVRLGSHVGAPEPAPVVAAPVPEAAPAAQEADARVPGVARRRAQGQADGAAASEASELAVATPDAPATRDLAPAPPSAGTLASVLAWRTAAGGSDALRPALRPAERAVALLEVSRHQGRSGELERAEQTLSRALDMARDIQGAAGRSAFERLHGRCRAAVLASKGLAATHAGSGDLAVDYFARAIQAAESLEPGAARIMAQARVAEDLRAAGFPASAEEVMTGAREGIDALAPGPARSLLALSIDPAARAEAAADQGVLIGLLDRPGDAPAERALALAYAARWPARAGHRGGLDGLAGRAREVAAGMEDLSTRFRIQAAVERSRAEALAALAGGAAAAGSDAEATFVAARYLARALDHPSDQAVALASIGRERAASGGVVEARALFSEALAVLGAEGTP